LIEKVDHFPGFKTLHCGCTESRLYSRITIYKYYIFGDNAYIVTIYRYHGRKSIYHVWHSKCYPFDRRRARARLCNVSLITTADRGRDIKLFARQKTRSRVQSVQSGPPGIVWRGEEKKGRKLRVSNVPIYKAITLFYHYFRLPTRRRRARYIYIILLILLAQWVDS